MSRIAQKSAETFLARMTMQIVAAGGAVVIARTLGPSGKGLFTYAVTLLGIFLTVGTGQSAAILWQYGRRQRPAAALHRIMVRVITVVSLPCAIALIVLGVLIPAQRTLLAVAAAFPFAFFAQSATGFLLADADVRNVNIQQAFPTIAAALVYVPLLLVFHVSLPGGTCRMGWRVRRLGVLCCVDAAALPHRGYCFRASSRTA